MIHGPSNVKCQDEGCLLKSTIHVSIHITRQINEITKNVFITYYSFTNIFRLLKGTSSGQFTRMLGIQTNMLQCTSEPHKFVCILNILVSYPDDCRDNNRNSFVNE